MKIAKNLNSELYFTYIEKVFDYVDKRFEQSVAHFLYY